MATTYYQPTTYVHQWQGFAKVDTTETPTTFTATITAGIYVKPDISGGRNSAYWYAYIFDSTGATVASSGKKTKNIAKGTYFEMCSKSYTWEKKTSSQSFTFKARGKNTGDAMGGTSDISFTITVPALTKYTVSYNKNTNDTVGNIPSSQTKIYGTTLKLASNTPTRSGYSFVRWNTSAGGGGTNYSPSGNYTANSGATLYAQWVYAGSQPTCDYTDVVDTSGYNTPKKALSHLKTTISNVVLDTSHGATSYTATLSWKGQTTSRSSVGDLTITPNSTGTDNVLLTLKDNMGSEKVYNLGEVTVEEPSWTQTVTITGKETPDINKQGYAIMTVKAKNFNTDAYVTIDRRFIPTIVGDNEWSFDITLSAPYVNTASVGYPDEAEMSIEVSYKHTVTQYNSSRQAFFNTTRNANFMNGLANLLFVGGTPDKDFSSRVWYSGLNNPKYFPDTNYVEVGSNDTAVMGLCKINDYLGVVKQSKTTDTTIFLLYPTSFEDDTAYAVKQIANGVGALSKYSFNVLGDETLFLSPDGIVAIDVSDDADHRIKNRSYYINKPMLSEGDLSTSYSFIYDGMYLLAINGRCYVLDGNQKTSWETSKTNLQYEAYYWENVPALYFAKCNDLLWFTDGNNLCRFKTKNDDEPYCDNDEPIRAKWTTILDDDRASNYFKNLQKKGNVVTLLGEELTSAKVYISKDGQEPIFVKEVTPKYEEVEITEEEFNAQKTKYFVIVEDKYVRCADDSVYSDEETYYVLVTIVGVPVDMYLRKKVKKYKRLQITIENDKNEPFGVNEIVKCYVLGNYAK